MRYVWYLVHGFRTSYGLGILEAVTCEQGLLGREDSMTGIRCLSDPWWERLQSPHSSLTLCLFLSPILQPADVSPRPFHLAHSSPTPSVCERFPYSFIYLVVPVARYVRSSTGYLPVSNISFSWIGKRLNCLSSLLITVPSSTSKS